jgi:phosphate transport system protein
MNRQLDLALDGIRKRLLEMGTAVEQSVEDATQALLVRSVDGFDRVRETEAKINRLQVEIDQECVELIAQYTPVARDLRLVIAAIKMTMDLERMGDQAMNITHCVKDYLKETPIDLSLRLSAMALTCRRMIADALDSFLRRDEALARKVLLRDDEVDAERDAIVKELLEIMQQDSEKVSSGLALILIARNLERLGDHATNIAEDVIYASSGEDVRHTAEKSDEKSDEK